MVDLGKSRVPLEEDLIKKKIEFIKSWLEWAASNLLIIKREGIAGTIYTVPENKTFFLTNSHVSAATPSVVGAATMNLTVTQTNFSIDFLNFAANLADNQTSNQSFIMPIKIESGSSIVLNVSGGVTAFAIIKGFEIDKRIS